MACEIYDSIRNMKVALPFNRPMRALSPVIFAAAQDRASLKNWDELAAENPINAAIAQDDESGEIKKGAHEYETILRECPGGILLDLGCGYGRVAKYVLPQRTYAHYIGVDDSIEMLQIFERRYVTRQEEQSTPLTLLKTSIEDLPLADASVDAVLTSAVWLHNPKDVVRRSIAEVRRVLKPGGKLLVFASFVNGENPAYLQEWMYSKLVLRMRGQMRRNGPVRVYGEHEVRSLLTGFTRTDLTRVGCRVLPIHWLVIPRMLNLKIWKAPIAYPFNTWACRALGRHSGRFCTHYDVIAAK